MTTELEEMQFELLPSEDASGSGFAFGIGREVSINADGFDPGEMSWVTQDTTNPVNGATQFGADYVTGKSWVWAAHVNREDTESGLASLGHMRLAWRAREIAGRTGAVTTLRYRVGNRVRRVYGRPRRFAAPPNNLLLGGFVPVTADFRTVDDLHYADTSKDVQFSFVPTTPETVMILPLTLPFNPLPIGEGHGAAVVGGDTPAYPVIRIDGPITNPSVTNGDWTLTLNTHLLDDDYVVIDTRPWHMTVLKNGVQSIAGSMSPRQWLEDVRLEPGPQTLTMTGSSGSAGATCAVSWRDCFCSL